MNKTQPLKTPTVNKQKVNFAEDIKNEDNRTEDQGGNEELETGHRPRADEVMKDLDLEIDLSESKSGMTNEFVTTHQSKKQSAAIAEEQASASQLNT